jgi:transcriptional regulator with XRE-family HTH domain
MEPTPNTTLRIAIAATGETQRAIAKRARIPETRFSAIARGRLNPNSKEQSRIARALNTTVDHLFPVAVTA